MPEHITHLAFVAILQASISTVACGLLEEQSAITDEYKDVLDQGSTDVARLPLELHELALSLVSTSAMTATEAGEHVILVPFPTSFAGIPQLMVSLLSECRSKLSSELQPHISVLPLLSRSEAVSQRSGLTSADRHSDAAQQLSTLIAAQGVQLPSGKLRFIIVDDLVHEGVSLLDGTYRASLRVLLVLLR